MLQRVVFGVVYSAILLLFLIGTNLLFLEQIINTENLSETTTQISHVIGVMLWLVAIGLWFFRRQCQKPLVFLLEDISKSFHVARQAWQQSLQTENRLHLALFGSIIILAIGLRLLFITQPIRTDEALTYLQFASKPLYLALSDYAAPNNHLLHTFFVHLSTRLFGNSEIAIRLPAFMLGIAMIPAAYLAIRTIYNKNAALLAAGLCAVSSVLIEYSVNARGYTLQTTLFLLALALAGYVRHTARPAAWLLLAILLAAGFYTVPTMLYGAVILMFWVLVLIMVEKTGQMRRKLLVYWIAAGIATGMFTLILYVPVFIVSGASAITSNSYVQSLDFSQFIAQIPQAFTTVWQQWHTSIQPIIAVLLVIGVIMATLLHRRIGQQPISLIGAIVLIIPAVLLLQRVHPFARIWLFLLPLYFGMAAAGVLCIFTWKNSVFVSIIGRFLAVVIIGVGAITVLQTQSPYHSIETGTFRDAEAITLFFAEQPTTEKIIYEHPSGESLRYYFLRHQLPVARLEWDYTPHEKIYGVINTEYSQDIASVFFQNGLRLAEYDVAMLKTYPLAAIFVAQQKN